MAASNFGNPQPTTAHMDREESVDRSSQGSDASVPSMVDDLESDFSFDDDQYYRTSGEQIWDTFWKSGCEEALVVETPVSPPSWQYPALVTPSLGLDAQQLLSSRKRPTQTQSLGTIDVPGFADIRSVSQASSRSARRKAIHPCRVSYSIFPPQQTEPSRQRTIRPRRCPPHLALETPKQRISSDSSSVSHFLRGSTSARNLRSGSASSAFSASSGFSVSTTCTADSEHTTITTPASSPRVSWDSSLTPKPKHVSQCLDTRLLRQQASVPNLRGPPRQQPTIRSVPAQNFAQGEAHNSFVVGAVTSEPYPRPLFSAPAGPLAQPMRRAPKPPVSERLPPPVAMTRPIPPPLILTSRPLPPLPLSLSQASRPSTPLSAPLLAPPRPRRPEHSQSSFGPALSPPRPPPFRAHTQPISHPASDFPPPVVSVFEWDSEGDSETEGHNASHKFAKRIARGFARVQNKEHHHEPVHKREHPQHSAANRSCGSDDLTRIRSGETVTRFKVHSVTRARALTVEDVKRAEEDMDKLRLAREQVAKERATPLEAAVVKGPSRQKSAFFQRMVGWRTQ